MHSVSVPVMDLLLAMSSAADLVSTAVANHHKRVAYLAGRIAEEHGSAPADVQAVVTAGAVHDLGVFGAREKDELREFDLDPVQRHAELGYRLLVGFPPMAEAAQLVRYHHTRWSHTTDADPAGLEVPLGSQVLHLADRIEVLITSQQYVLSQVKDISETIAGQRGGYFHPQLVDAFLRLASREYLWLDVRSPRIDDLLRREFNLPVWELSLTELRQLAELLARIIDFKSPFTSTHTAGVAAASVELARLLSFSTAEQELIAIAGYLHDLGKLAIPAEILEKPAALSDEEFDMMRSHTYHTRRILETIPGLETIAGWAAGHHERLDGSGYPFHLSDLSLGARVIAVADVFTAVSEDRPYRAGMEPRRVCQVLKDMVADGKLDERLVSLLIEHFDQIDDARREAQATASQRYAEITDSAA